MAKRRGKKQSKEETQVVAVVREWEPQRTDSLGRIHAAVDALGHAGSLGPSAEPAPARDYAEIEAAVDRITKRVKARKVTVTETVTEWVDEDETVAVREPVTPAWSPSGPEKTEVPAPPRSGKRKPRILGFLGPKSQKKAQDDALAERAANADDASAGPGSHGLNPQCAALTEDGAQCRNSSRDGSKYCASHKGWQPPTAKGLAQRIEGDAWDPSDKVSDHASVRGADTRPRARRAKDTKVAVRKAPARAAKRGTSARKRKGAGKTR